MIWDDRDGWVSPDPFVHGVRDEPPDPDDDDFAMSLFDATTGEFFDA